MKPPIHLIGVSVFATATALAQGPLAPPGAPGPVFRTLLQVEPRTPISTVPFTISAPGSYYLTTNLTTGAGNVLLIAADNVVLDLNGFSVRAGAGGAGITANDPQRNVVVRNGTVRNCGSDGVQLGQVTGAQVVDVMVMSNSASGIVVGGSGQVRNSVSRANGGAGIQAGGGSQLTQCGAHANGGVGISAADSSTILGCSANANQADNIVTGFGVALSQCAANNSVSNSGFVLGTGNIITGSAATGNKKYGIDSYQRSSVQNCTASHNGKAGIRANLLSSVQQSTCVNNGSYGIISDFNGYGTIAQNTCSYNGLLASTGNPTNGAGIFITNSPGCRVEGNTVSVNFVGLLVAPNNRALILRNSASSSISANYVLGAGNSWGPLVNVNSVGDFSGTANANHPQANFSH